MSCMEKGWEPMPDGIHCFIFSAKVKLEPGYTGEWCDDCNCWTARIDKVQP